VREKQINIIIPTRLISPSFYGEKEKHGAFLDKPSTVLLSVTGWGDGCEELEVRLTDCSVRKAATVPSLHQRCVEVCR